MKLTGQKSLCRTCGLYFNSVAAFDKHRTGKHGQDRRCMGAEEMVAAGMVANARGYWISAKATWRTFAN